MRLNATLEGKYWYITWGGCSRDEWFATKDFVKALPGNPRWLPDEPDKPWRVRNNLEVRNEMALYGFRHPDLPTSGEVENRPKEPPPWLGVEIPEHLFPDLRPYQLDYLRFMKHSGYRGGNGDEMGTGKTVMACSLLKMLPDHLPAVIVVTANAKIQWRREVRKWVSQASRVYILTGRTPQRLMDPRGIYIVNWDILNSWLPALVKLEPMALIGDEIQYIGGHTSQMSKAFRTLAHMPTAKCVTVLSGTPINTRLDQYWPVLDALSPGLFPDQDKFLKRYYPYQYIQGELKRAAKRQDELYEVTKHLWIRRLKSEVLPDLPEKVYVPIEMECSPDSAYDEALKKVMGLQGLNHDEMNERLQGLSLSAFYVKREAVLAWIAEWLKSTEEKLTIFAWHRAVMDILQQALGDSCVRVDGGVTGPARDKAVQEFQTNPKKRVFLGNIKAAGVALDGLQNVCSNAAYVEFSWSPSVMSQADDRFHRIGQRSSVTLYYLVAPGTVDEAFFKSLTSRSKDISRVIDGDRSGGAELKSVLSLLKSGAKS